MKKCILFVMLMASMLFASCLQNEEPTSLIEMRSAKASLINAEAQLKVADAAYRAAETALMQSKVENQNLLNKLQELNNAAMEIQNEIDALDLEIAKAQSEAKIAEYAAEKKRQEKLLLDQTNLIEEAIEQHKLAMYDLLKRVEEAKKGYDDALLLLEAKKLALTAEQQALLDGYTTKITEIQGLLVAAQEDLIEANDKLARDKYAYDAQNAINLAVLDSIAKEYNLAIANEALNRFEAFTKMDMMSEWQKAVEDLQKEIMKAHASQDSVNVVKGQLEESKGPVQGAKDRLLNQQRGIVNDISNDTYDPADNDPNNYPYYIRETVNGTKKWFLENSWDSLNMVLINYNNRIDQEKYTEEFAIDSKIQDNIHSISNYISPDNILVGFEMNPNSGLYSLPEGKNFTIQLGSQQMGAFLNNFHDLIFYGFIYSDNDLAVLKNNLNQYKVGYNDGIKKYYDLAIGKWNTLLPAVLSKMEEYKLGYGTDAQDVARAAYNKFAAKTTTEQADSTELFAAIKSYITLREELTADTVRISRGSLTDKPVIKYLTVKDFKDGNILMGDISDAVNVTKLTEDGGLINPAADVTGLNEENYDIKYGMLPRWRHLSTLIFNQEKLRASITKETFGDSWSMIWRNSGPRLANIGHITDLLENNGYYNVIPYLEYITCTDLESSLWWRYMAGEFHIGYFQALIDNQATYKALLSDIEESQKENEKIQEDVFKFMEDIDAKKAAIVLAIEDAHLEAAEFNIPIAEKDAELAAIDREIAIKGEIATGIGKRITNLTTLSGVYLKYITDAYNAAASDNIVKFVDNDEIKAAFAKEIKYLRENIADAEEELKEAKETLIMLREGVDTDSTAQKVLIANDEAEIARLEVKIAKLMAEYEYYNDLLMETIALFLGEPEE